MVNNKIEELRGRLGEETNKLQQQEVAKLKAPYVQALQDIANRQQQQHEAMQQPADYTGIPGYADGKDITGIVPFIPNIPKIKIGAQPDMLSPQPAPQGIPTPTPEVSIPGADEHGNTGNDEDKKPEINGIYKINNRDNLAVAIAGMGISLGQYLDAKGQDIKTPDVYAANPYERQALSTMANIRVSPYAAMNKVRDMNRVAARLINTSGGLSGGQKYSALVGSMLGTQRNMADVLTSTQAQNNQYRQQYAQLAGELGAKDAANRMAANQYNTEYAAKAHAARQQGMQQGMTNFLGQLQQYIANKNSADMYNGMRAIYQQDADTRKQALNNQNKNAQKAEYTGYKYMMPNAKYFVSSPVQNPLTFGSTIPTTPFVKDSDLWLPPVRKASVSKNGGNRRPRTKNKKR